MIQINYPEIYLSNKIKKLICSTPDLPEKPKEPIVPILPQKPDKPQRSGCLFLSGPIAILGLVLVFSGNIDVDGDAITMVILAISLILMTPIMIAIHRSDKEKYEEELLKYKDYVEEYPSLIAEYEQKKEEYSYRLKEYNVQIAKLTSDAYLQNFHRTLINDYLFFRTVFGDDIPKFLCCTNEDAVKIGASEMFFRRILEEHGFTIHVDKKIEAGSKFYYPDILIEKCGLYIDVEIDEPYSGDDGTPIHYLDKYGQSIDEKRNACFISQGFEIIRFAEEQIFLYPEDCVTIINKFIDLILEGNDFDSISTDIAVKKWTIEEAHKFAYRQFRKTYIPMQYKKYIDKENLQSYSELREQIEQDCQRGNVDAPCDDLPF